MPSKTTGAPKKRVKTVKPGEKECFIKNICLNKYLRFAIPVLIVLVILIAILLGYKENKREFVFYPMGGIPFKIVAYGRNEIEFNDDTIQAKERVEELEDAFNRYRVYSKISIINARAYKEFTAINEDMSRIFDESKKWYDLSDGAFDVTVLPLILLWKDRQALPNEHEILETLANVGMQNVFFNVDGMVKLGKKGVGVDFGGIAKGFIVDEVARLLQDRGVKSGLVEAGGDLTVWGEGKYNVGIQDPFNENSLIGRISLKNRAVVTSGIYQRFVEIDGKKYPHIIDPRNGMPIDNDLVSVSIFTSKTADADAVATAVSVLGKNDGINFLKKMSSFDVVLIDRSGDLWISEGIADSITLAPEKKKNIIRLTE